MRNNDLTTSSLGTRSQGGKTIENTLGTAEYPAIAISAFCQTCPQPHRVITGHPLLPNCQPEKGYASAASERTWVSSYHFGTSTTTLKVVGHIHCQSVVADRQQW
mmetsp:Transcript_48497/g.81559  ORF Transcript_48497/g.81559 Transcript_48497/m.81559 type:complete len:105 (+) Transcript_48497:820-1134(+)